MAKSMFIKRERCLLLPYDKCEQLLTQACNMHKDNQDLEEICEVWVERIREYKTLPNVPVTQKEFTKIKHLIETPF